MLGWPSTPARSSVNPIAAISASVARITAPPARPLETRGASVVRPVVFGATDGLACNISLIMGVAAAGPKAASHPRAFA